MKKLCLVDAQNPCLVYRPCLDAAWQKKNPFRSCVAPCNGYGTLAPCKQLFLLGQSWNLSQCRGEAYILKAGDAIFLDFRPNFTQFKRKIHVLVSVLPISDIRIKWLMTPPWQHSAWPSANRWPAKAWHSSSQTPGPDINIFLKQTMGVGTPASVNIKDDLPPTLS